jgi:hypothetical protein
MKQTINPEHVIQQLRRLQTVFANEESSIAMRMSNRRGKHGLISTVVGYVVTHERLSDPIISTCPKRAVDKLMAKRHITRVEQYCRMFLQGGAA